MTRHAFHALCLVPVFAGGCLQAQPRTLAELGGATLRVNAWNDSSKLRARDLDVMNPGLVVDLVGEGFQDDDCSELDEGVTATLNDVPLTVERRGSVETDEGHAFCSQPVFRLEGSATPEIATVVVRDPSAEWVMTIDHLFASEFRVVATDPALEISWRDAPPTFAAEVRTSSQTGTCVDRVVGHDSKIVSQLCRPGILDVTTYGARTPSSCTGPALCQASSRAGATL